MVVLKDKTAISLSLLVPLGAIVGAWIALSGDVRASTVRVDIIEKVQARQDEKYEKIIDTLSDVKSELKTIQLEIKKQK